MKATMGNPPQICKINKNIYSMYFPSGMVYCIFYALASHLPFDNDQDGQHEIELMSLM